MWLSLVNLIKVKNSDLATFGVCAKFYVIFTLINIELTGANHSLCVDITGNFLNGEINGLCEWA